MRPRLGTRYSMRTRLSPCTIWVSSPLRAASSWVTAPRDSVGHVDRQVLERLVQLAVDHLGDDLGLADGQLEALAAHRLDQDGQRQLAAALHLPGVGALGGQHADAHVADQLGVEPAPDLAGGELGARVRVAAHQRRGVDADRHRDGGLVDGDAGQRDGVVRVGEGVADRDLRDAGDRDEVTRARAVGRDARERLGAQQLGDLDAGDGAVGTAPRDLLAPADRAGPDPAQRDAAEEAGGVEVGDVRLQRGVRVVRRRGHGVEQDVEQRLQVRGRRAACRRRGGRRRRGRRGRRRRRPAGRAAGRCGPRRGPARRPARARSSRLSSTTSPMRASARSVLFTTSTTGRPCGEGLAQHEPGLRQRALGGVDEQEHAVHHRQARARPRRRSRRGRGCRRR